MVKILYFFLVNYLIAALACKSGKPAVYSGESVEQITSFWQAKNNDTTQTSMLEHAWYRDSIGVTQVCGMFTEETDTSSIVTIRTIKYRLVDLRKMWAYEYLTFTDTAQITRKFKITESERYGGGWNFAFRTPHAVDSFRVLPDTTIDAIAYKRCNLSYIFNDARFDGSGLARCDKNGTAFEIDTAISTKIGCSLVFLRISPRFNPHSGIDRRIKFVSNNFPDSVARVFTAWKKNESLYPVR
jgi:hypothetical protein